jgi:hypothetical protein
VHALAALDGMPTGLKTILFSTLPGLQEWIMMNKSLTMRITTKKKTKISKKTTMNKMMKITTTKWMRMN